MLEPSETQLSNVHRLAGEILDDLRAVSEKLKKYKNALSKNKLALSGKYIDSFRDASNGIGANLFLLSVDRYKLEQIFPQRIISPQESNNE